MLLVQHMMDRAYCFCCNKRTLRLLLKYVHTHFFGKVSKSEAVSVASDKKDGHVPGATGGANKGHKMKRNPEQQQLRFEKILDGSSFEVLFSTTVKLPSVLLLIRL